MPFRALNLSPKILQAVQDAGYTEPTPIQVAAIPHILAGHDVIGIAQTFGAAINPEWQILAGHLAFLLVLLVRPRGLFPRSVD